MWQWIFWDFFFGPAKYFSVWQDFHVCQSFGLTTSQQVSGSLSDRKIFCRSGKKIPKNSLTCMMFSLAFLEWFTLVLAIGHLISPLVFIEVQGMQLSVLFKIGYVMPFIVCVSSFVVLMTLYYKSMIVWKTSCHWLIYIQITNRVVIVFTNGFGWNRKCIKGVKTMKIM